MSKIAKPWVSKEEFDAYVGGGIIDVLDHAADHEVGGGDLLAFADITGFGDWLDQALRQADSPTFANLTISTNLTTPKLTIGAFFLNSLVANNKVSDSDLWDGYQFADYLDQSVKQAASPTHVTVKLTALTNGYIPYHVSDAAGLADSPLSISGANLLLNGGSILTGYLNTATILREVGAAEFSGSQSYAGFGIVSEGGTNRQAYIFVDGGGGNIIFNIVTSVDAGVSWHDRFVVTQSGKVQVGDLTVNTLLGAGASKELKSLTTIAGLTIGHVLKATSPTAVAFQANNLGGLSDVNLGSLEEGETLAYDQATAKWIDAWGVEYDNPRLVWKMYTDFFSSAVDANDPWVGFTISGGSKASLAGTSNHPGIIRFTTDNVTNSGYRFLTATNCILIAGAEHSEFVFRTGSPLTNLRVRLGFQDKTIVTEPTDGVYINLHGSTLTGKTRNNGAESTTGTSYTIIAATWYRGKIAVNNDATLVTFILYSAAGTQLWSQTLAANIPTATGRETGHGIVMYVASNAYRSFDLDMMVATRAGYITR